MQTYAVTFWNSEGAIEIGYPADERTILAKDGVQLTYEELRETDNGEPLAHLSHGFWRIADTEDDYSDVSITVATEEQILKDSTLTMLRAAAVVWSES